MGQVENQVVQRGNVQPPQRIGTAGTDSLEELDGGIETEWRHTGSYCHGGGRGILAEPGGGPLLMLVPPSWYYPASFPPSAAEPPMRSLLALLALGAVACSDDPVQPKTPPLSLSVATGTYYTGWYGTVDVTNTGSTVAEMRQIDCGNPLDRRDGDSWVSLWNSSSVCNFVAISPGETATFFFNIPENTPTGSFRVTTVLRQGEARTSVSSNSFAVDKPPACTGDPAPEPCTPI